MNLPDKYRVIDLTQPIHEKMTTWPGDPQTRHENWAEISSHGFFLNALTIGAIFMKLGRAPATRKIFDMLSPSSNILGERPSGIILLQPG